MTDIYAFAYGRTRETIVPPHRRQALVSGEQNHMPDLVGVLQLTPSRMNRAAYCALLPPAAERERVTS